LGSERKAASEVDASLGFADRVKPTRLWGMGCKGALAIVVGLVAPLFGCGAVDSGVTYLPESFRQPAPKLAEIEQPPDVHLIVRNNISTIFMAAASPSNISVSFPVPAQYGGWTTCVKALARGITGRSLGTQTYLVNIEHDRISQREHVDDAHWCAKETFESL